MKQMKMFKTINKKISFKTIENKITNQEDKYNIQLKKKEWKQMKMLKTNINL